MAKYAELLKETNEKNFEEYLKENKDNGVNKEENEKDDQGE